MIKVPTFFLSITEESFLILLQFGFYGTITAYYAVMSALFLSGMISNPSEAKYESYYSFS